MRKIFMFFAGAALFLMLSCPAEIVKRSHWKGQINSDLGNSVKYNNSHKTEFFFNNDGTCTFIIFVSYKTLTPEPVDYSFSGTYYIDSNYNLTADGMNNSEKVDLIFEGILNTTNGVGSGDVKINNNYNNAFFSVVPVVNGSWELLKLN